MSNRKHLDSTKGPQKSPVPVKITRSKQRVIHPAADQIQFWQQSLGNQATRQLLTGGNLGVSHYENPRITREDSVLPGIQRQASDEAVPEQTDSEAAQSRKVDTSTAIINWDEPQKAEDVISGSLTGGGRHDPHMQREGTYRFPDVSIEYDLAQKVWRVTTIKVYSRIVVHLPDNGAYPVLGTNVLNQPGLGVRTPKGDPAGKGHWADVVKNLLLYRLGVDFSKLQWWVRDSTEFHERKHHELYQEWFNKQWKVARKLLEDRLQTKLQNREIQPVTRSKLEKAAGFILQGIIEEMERNLPDTEPQAYHATRKQYWEPKAQEIEGQAKEKGWT